jgi:hypothetical protein
MSWPATFGVALVTGLGGMLATGYTANLAVSWYRISSFEGQSGYFVVFLGLAGLILGTVIGFVVARVVNGSFAHAAVTALGVVAGLTLLIAGPARLLADVPPRLGGDTLLLALEYRWPASQVEAPVAGADDPYVRLGSVSGGTERSAATGAFWLEDSRREEGRWISPAAVQLFTERGKRAVLFMAGGDVQSGAIVPLPRRPGARYLEWSAWLPAGAPGIADGASYRFRVHRSSEPIRVERFGPFEAEMRAESFWMAQDPAGHNTIDATAAFTIRHNGEPVVVEREGMYGSTASPRLDRASALAVIDAPRPALLACMIRYDRPCFLLVSDDAGLRTEYVADLPAGEAGYQLTSEQAPFELTRDRAWSRGRLHRTLFERDGIYLLGPALLDTRGPRVLQVKDDSELMVQQWVAPPGLAPDAQTFVRIASTVEGDALLVVAELDGSNAYTLPIDRTRMPWEAWEDITPAWLQRHFEWVRGDGGSYRLVERSGSSAVTQ